MDDALAQLWLGHAYYYANGVKKDLAKAIKYYTMAGLNGNEKAQHQLFYLYAFEEGVIDYKQSMAWAKKSIEQNNQKMVRNAI